MRCGGGQSGVRRKDSYLGSFKRLVLLRHLLLDGQVLLLLEPAARGVAIALARRRLGRGGDSRGFSSPSERQEKQQREMSG